MSKTALLLLFILASCATTKPADPRQRAFIRMEENTIYTYNGPGNKGVKVGPAMILNDTTANTITLVTAVNCSVESVDLYMDEVKATETVTKEGTQYIHTIKPCSKKIKVEDVYLIWLRLN